MPESSITERADAAAQAAVGELIAGGAGPMGVAGEIVAATNRFLSDLGADGLEAAKVIEARETFRTAWAAAANSAFEKDRLW